MAKVGKFYMVGSNQYFVAEKTTKECWAGNPQTFVRVILLPDLQNRHSMRQDFVALSEIPEPAFDRVANKCCEPDAGDGAKQPIERPKEEYPPAGGKVI